METGHMPTWHWLIQVNIVLYVNEWTETLLNSRVDLCTNKSCYGCILANSNR